MASNSETGHAKNIALFEDLISFCIGYGAAFNPANANITITALQAKHTAALAGLQAVKTAKTAYDNATNAREIIFAPFKKLSTRIINALIAVSPAKQTIADAKTINNKIQGRRSSKVAKSTTSTPSIPSDEPSAPAGSTISVSQQSFDSLIDNFAKLIEILSAEPLYVPNEAELSVAGLNTLLTEMKTANTAVINAITTYSNARIARDKTLYLEGEGLVSNALDVKKYVKSLFGATSPQFKQVSKLKFKSLPG